MPYEWRNWIVALGLAAVFACYRYPAGDRDRLVLLLHRAKGRTNADKDALEKEVMAARKTRDTAAWRHATAGFVGPVTMVGAFEVALNRQLHPWRPSNVAVEILFFRPIGIDVPFYDSAEEVLAEGPCFLER